MKVIYIVVLLFLMGVGNGYAQQKANFKLADRFTSTNLGGADRNSMSIYPMYINVDPKKREKRLLFNPEKFFGFLNRETCEVCDKNDFNLQDVKFDPKGTSFTFAFEKFRYRYNMKTEEMTKLDSIKSEEYGESWLKYSPDSVYVMFAKGHNLFVKGNKNKGMDTTEVQLTTDGEKYFSYVEEEDEWSVDTIEMKTLAVWLKDSRKIYALREDTRDVEELWMC